MASTRAGAIVPLTHPERPEGPGPMTARQPTCRHGANASDDEYRPPGLTSPERRSSSYAGRSPCSSRAHLAMRREDAMRLLGELGQVRGRFDRLSDGVRALLADEDA